MTINHIELLNETFGWNLAALYTEVGNVIRVDGYGRAWIRSSQNFCEVHAESTRNFLCLENGVQEFKLAVENVGEPIIKTNKIVKFESELRKLHSFFRNDMLGLTEKELINNGNQLLVVVADFEVVTVYEKIEDTMLITRNTYTYDHNKGFTKMRVQIVPDVPEKSSSKFEKLLMVDGFAGASWLAEKSRNISLWLLDLVERIKRFVSSLQTLIVNF